MQATEKFFANTIIKLVYVYLYKLYLLHALYIYINTNALVDRSCQLRRISKMRRRQSLQPQGKYHCQYRYVRHKDGPCIMHPKGPRMIQHHHAKAATSTKSKLGCPFHEGAKNQLPHSFETDSFDSGINNHVSYCMTPHETNFVGKPHRVNVQVRGVAGTTKAGLKGRCNGQSRMIMAYNVLS